MVRVFATLVVSCFLLLGTARADTLLIETEQFQSHGGWVLDTQFTDIMGSPYLMAHGLGTPVADASTTVTLPKPGKYHLWVRTKDWVAPWKAPGTPGKFQVLIDGKAVSETFGTRGEDWSWHDGGQVQFSSTKATLSLHDLTGFNGRCDAIVLSSEAGFVPPNEKQALAQWRRKSLGVQLQEAGAFDVIVVGGGYGGTAAAISAARMGCKVALIQDRPVLGGNGSSEVRVWAMGGIRTGLYPHLGEIVEEFMDRAKASPGPEEQFADDLKEKVVRSQKNLTLFLNRRVFAAEMEGKKIKAVHARDTRTSQEFRFAGTLFVDATGHGSLGGLAGADHTLLETGHLGMSNMWRWEDTKTPQAFPETPWALNLEVEDFPYPRKGHAEWFWESGFDKHPLRDLELVRDWNLRANFGAWNALKNRGGKDKHVNARLTWMAYIGGTRESRQLLGDVILGRDDITAKKAFDDGCVPTTWDIDLHYPKQQYMKKFPDNPFISRAEFGAGVDRKHGYPVPYRSFYSRNIDNLFMAGRCVSVTHEALGTVRVMKTGGMIGEVVGKAASICLRESCSPREVYTKHLDQLKQLMQLPGAAQRDTVQGTPTVGVASP